MMNVFKRQWWWKSVYLSTYLSTYLSIYIYIYLYLYLYLYIYLSIYLSFYLSIYLSIIQCRIQMCFRYHLNHMGTQKNAPKKVLVTLFLYLFHVKTKQNIVYKYLKTEIFSIDANILPQMHWALNIFGPSATTMEGLGYH